MALETITGVGFSYWASYLINGDDSGIEESDKVQADKFAAWLGGNIVDVEEESHFARPDFPADCLLGDCVTYTALIESPDIEQAAILAAGLREAMGGPLATDSIIAAEVDAIKNKESI